MSDTLGPLAALVGPTAAPVAHWLYIVRVADPESIRRVCLAHGRAASVRTVQRVIRTLVDAGLASVADRPHTTRVVIATGTVLSPRTLGHDLIVSRVSAVAMECGWSWERDVADRNEHLADGILTDEDGRRIGVEVEMTRKTIARTRQILLGHGRVPHRYNGVLYVGTTDTMRYISEVATRTGTADALRGTASAVAKWNQDIDNDVLTRAVTELRTTAPAPHQLAIGDTTTDPPRRPAPAAPANTAEPRTSTAPERNFPDSAFLNFRVPVDPDALTDADRRAARAVMDQRLQRAEVSGDTATVTNIHRRQKELGLA